MRGDRGSGIPVPRRRPPPGDKAFEQAAPLHCERLCAVWLAFANFPGPSRARVWRLENDRQRRGALAAAGARERAAQRSWSRARAPAGPPRCCGQQRPERRRQQLCAARPLPARARVRWKLSHAPNLGAVLYPDARKHTRPCPGPSCPGLPMAQVERRPAVAAGSPPPVERGRRPGLPGRQGGG